MATPKAKPLFAASAPNEVEIFNGSTSLGKTNVAEDGTWSIAVTDLTVTSHELIAKALYGSMPVSTPWRLTVEAKARPTLTSVRDAKGEVANGGSTTDTTVTVSGGAAESEDLKIYDGAALKGTVTADSAGRWSIIISSLALGAHSLKAVALYGNGAESAARTFTVQSPVPDFVLDRSPVTLNGRFYGLAGHPGRNPLAWPAGTTAQRSPSSGVPPYTYATSDGTKLRADNDGKIYSAANGTVTVTVTDSAGRSGSYSVTVSNVTRVLGLAQGNYKTAGEKAAAAGMSLPSIDALEAIFALYGNTFPMGNANYWSNTAAPGIAMRHVKNLVTGQRSTLTQIANANVVGVS